jgi:hypothetical protein
MSSDGDVSESTHWKAPADQPDAGAGPGVTRRRAACTRRSYPRGSSRRISTRLRPAVAARPAGRAAGHAPTAARLGDLDSCATSQSETRAVPSAPAVTTAESSELKTAW